MLYLRANSLQRNKFTESRWEEGVYVGIREESNELLIATLEGILKARTFRPRGSIKESWNKSFFNKCTGSPWEPVIRRDGIEVKSSVRLQEDQEEEDIGKPEQGEVNHRQFRSFQIRRQEVIKHGATPACNGCKAALARTKAVNHTETCRKRIGAEFRESNDPRLDREGKRLTEYMEQQYDDSIRENKEEEASEHEMNADDKKAIEEDIADVFGNEDDEIMLVRSKASSKMWRTNEENDMMKMQKINEMNDDEYKFWGDISQMAYDSMQSQAHFYDDISGEELDSSMVMAARTEELQEFFKHGVYEQVPIEECYEQTGKSPIGVRWVDVNKGDKINPEYRSRLVAKEIKIDERRSIRSNAIARSKENAILPRGH